mmetsp:Transcript_10174/g.24704  ORF Transcript_10174/g.24704 Transcript_10174/m.24704 type:complete len:420 (+) Transcript_10174:177-1436(+)
MGKRVKGAKLRSKKRGTEAEREIVEKHAVRVEESAVIEKADDELFVLDTTAVVESKKQIAKKEKKKREQSVSAKEQLQIQKLVDTHSAEKLRTLAKKTSITSKRAPKFIKLKQNRPTHDLWADEDNEGSSTVAPKKSAPIAVSSGPHGIVPSRHVKIGTARALPPQAALKKDRLPVTVDLPKPGQSFNPDRKEHRIAIVEALKIETKREKAEKEAKQSASQGMSAETRALLLGDSDTEDEEDSDNESDDSEMVVVKRKPEKMTRAQRNKQKRIRAEQHEIQERKRQKQWQHELRGVKSVKKKIQKEELERKETKEKLEQLKKESERSKGKDVYQQLADENPRYAPTYPVALPTDLKSGTSLRRIKPKGSLVTDRMVSLMDRGMTAKKQLKMKMRVEGKRRKVKVRGKAKWKTTEGQILG